MAVDTPALLARPDNDFGWSSFPAAETALSEIDGIAADLRGGGSGTHLRHRVAGTGAA
ncbi:hypothetical protein [Dactylosporangium fulvum]|uniref:Uncharacterized protein n=1 Tax=Dactylosporangium fulvum TaxID=53359 RepID=A0ABY5WAI5_9ACTN|nr:hypothetical protein [Dactylosporangium fulvum]UWP87068.1 hypothetical protein Dfulv_23630 [Dactylosporangium fulvum]